MFSRVKTSIGCVTTNPRICSLWYHFVGLVGLHLFAMPVASLVQLTHHNGLRTDWKPSSKKRWWVVPSATTKRPSTCRKPLRLSATSNKSPCFSLAESYLIRLDHQEADCSFRLIALDSFREAIVDNARSLVGMTESSLVNQYFNNEKWLLSCETETRLQYSNSLSARYCSSINRVTVSVSSSHDSIHPLFGVLAKVLAHHLISTCNGVWHDNISVDLPDRATVSLQGCDFDEIPCRLFGVDKDSVEMVEMVDHRGAMIGAIPRSLVHRHNLLHRGVGVFVTKGATIRLDNDIQPDQPDLYVHRRASAKKIFPSLYDMFVGGVSEMKESPLMTARREVAEELGLWRAEAMTGPLLQCVVCTAHNRCVVELFSYVANVNEKIKWQEEEVSWGDFVPYALVEAAADKSILRCDPWPGILPKFQSWRMGQILPHESCDTHDEEWKTWDFVPDGLLVWVAWARFLEERTE
jgi:isopentenyldiphosphate isomerase